MFQTLLSLLNTFAIEATLTSFISLHFLATAIFHNLATL